MRTRIAVVVAVLVILFVDIGGPAQCRACTAFLASTPEGHLVAKGFDWITGEGWIVWNERGRTRSLLFADGSPQDTWTSRYASLTLTTVGPGFPVSGMNEAGLAIEALVDLSGRPTSSAQPGQLTGLEFVQYGLDRFASVAELADFAEGAEIVQLAVALHFFVCERGGACVVVELHQGKARIQRKLAVSALANRPYEEDLRAHQPPSGIAAWLGLGRPKPGSSAARFRTVANAARSTTPEDESAALAILERVVMGHRTQWQIVWNLERGTVLLRQREAGLGTLNLRLGDLDGRCAGAPRVRSLGRAVRGAFLPWTEQDAAHTEAAVLLQVGRDSPAPRRLASAVAGATRSSRCLSAQ